jgi:hypothetical protein
MTEKEKIPMLLKVNVIVFISILVNYFAGVFEIISSSVFFWTQIIIMIFAFGVMVTAIVQFFKSKKATVTLEQTKKDSQE